MLLLKEMILPLDKPAADPRLWRLDPSITFLNHGSFGSCPRAILDYQNELRALIEAEPVQFFVKKMEPLLDEARGAAAKFVGCHSDNLVFVQNATSGINTILRSLSFKLGDELLVTNQEYNACRNALNFVAERSGASIIIADIPFPINSPEQAVSALLEKVSPRTKLVLIDHVTSQTGMVLPLNVILKELNSLGIRSLIDGAHAPGMVPLNISELNPTYYTGNCHKWMCAPKTSAFLYVRPGEEPQIRPLTISHGANTTRKDRSRFQVEFAWMGTSDPTSALCLPRIIEYFQNLVPGGWTAIMERNRNLALEARRLLCSTVNSVPPCPDSMIGSLATIPMPPRPNAAPSTSPLYGDPQQDQLFSTYNIEVPFIPWGPQGGGLLRISAQLYNHMGEYQKLASALKEIGV